MNCAGCEHPESDHYAAEDFIATGCGATKDCQCVGFRAMSDNRFAHCDNREFVLSQFVLFTNRARTISETCDLRADALARITELTPRTVDAEQRERVRKIVSGWVDGMQCHTVTDRIIDALGYTVAPQPKPVVDGERLKEARGIMDHYLGMAYRREVGSQSITLICEAVDRIIEALGWPAADSWPTPAINPDDGSPTDLGPCDEPCDACHATTPPATQAVELAGEWITSCASLIAAVGALIHAGDELAFRRCGVSAVMHRTGIRDGRRLIVRIGGER